MSNNMLHNLGNKAKNIREEESRQRNSKALTTRSVQLRYPLYKKLKLMGVQKDKSIVSLNDYALRYAFDHNIFKNMK